MDRPTAEKLMSIYKRLGLILNEVDSVISTLPDEERKTHARGLTGPALPSRRAQRIKDGARAVC